MSQYDAPAGVEGDFQPGSRKRVLRNLLGIKRKTEMDAAENEALKAAQEKYYNDPGITDETRFTAELICGMHREWLGGIYE